MEIDHLGIAVERLDAALAAFEPVVGGKAPPPEVVESQGVRVAFLAVGGTHLEFLEPVRPDSAVARFLAKRGEGLHHLAFHVPSVADALAGAAARGARLIDVQPRPGARGRRVGFVHPSALNGVLVEFVEGP
ncbi:MAG TPA: methylmalonyl-CoA epimerase [Thermoplasmata archaeon]|nr:methylmalonyl-CoA epimerase [Thermoplasmata archaeon]